MEERALARWDKHFNNFAYMQNIDGTRTILETETEVHPPAALQLNGLDNYLVILDQSKVRPNSNWTFVAKLDKPNIEQTEI